MQPRLNDRTSHTLPLNHFATWRKSDKQNNHLTEVVYQPKNVTVLWPVPSYTAWWQRHIGVNNLPKVVMQLCPGGNWTTIYWCPMPYHYANALVELFSYLLRMRSIQVNNWPYFLPFCSDSLTTSLTSEPSYSSRSWYGRKNATFTLRYLQTNILLSVQRIAITNDCMYRENLNTIRMILTKSRGPVEGLRIIQIN